MKVTMEGLPKPVLEELNYIFEDISSYDELTQREKEIWSREDFAKLCANETT